MGVGAGCPRAYCAACDEEMIHRDHRGPKESASALGQIVGREGPVNLAVTDLDLVARKGLKDGMQLLRLIEQKQPDHTLRPAQEKTLRLIDRAILHCIQCPDAQGLRLDHRSGLYLLRGHIAGETLGNRRTQFAGPQRLIQVRTNKYRDLDDHEELFELLDPEDPSRRRGMGWKETA